MAFHTLMLLNGFFIKKFVIKLFNSKLLNILNTLKYIYQFYG